MKQKLRKKLVFIICLLVVVGGLAFLLSPSPEQTRNMRETQREIELLKKELASDSRFSNLKISPTTSNYGKEMLIIGSIPDELSLVQLKSMVERRVPEKYDIRFYIKIKAVPEDPNRADAEEQIFIDRS
jgi:hypothetical protein